MKAHIIIDEANPPDFLSIQKTSLVRDSMLAAIKAINAKIRSNKTLDYFCSTHFWGPASNFGIPIAAVTDIQKDPEIISGRMTGAFIVTSALLMRYSLAVRPKNYLLFAMHTVNVGAQSIQAMRLVNYWYLQDRKAETVAVSQ